MAFNELIEALNNNNYLLFISFGSVLGILMIFMLIKNLSSSKRGKISPVDVYDLQLEKESRGTAKKIKQKKVKTSQNAPPEGASAASRLKSPGKQSSPKITTTPSKQKQTIETDAKSKAAIKKEISSLTVSSQQTQQVAEVLGDWTVAGSKKKLKNKKTDPSVQDSKSQTVNTIQTKDLETVNSKLAKTSVEAGTADFSNKVLTKKVTESLSTDESDAVHSEINRVKKLAQQQEQPRMKSEEPVELSNGITEVSPAAGNESKPKTSSKKKKSKSPAERTDERITVSNFQDALVAKKASACTVTMTASFAQNAQKQVDSTADDSSLNTAKEQITSKAITAGKTKGTSKGKSLEISKESLDNPSRTMTSGSSTASPGIKTSEQKIPETDKTTVPETSSNVPSGIDVVKGVPSNACKDIGDLSKAIQAQPVPQLVFDELGLKDNSMDDSQSALKKKKKARRDV